MTRDHRNLFLAVVPGLVMAASALVGLVPTGRDLPEYFFPLRDATAQVLRGERSPSWIRESGCGEPFFANPQSAVLYPPAWLGVVLPIPRAVGVEIGFHIALLGLGAAVLARALGARLWWAVAAGWVAALAGPTLDSAGVLNNLATVAWLPWLWWATLTGRPIAMTISLALAVLGAEPQLAAAGAAVALTLGPLRRTLPPLLAGAAMVAVQLLPFLLWVAGGDRHVSPDAEWAAAGALSLGEIPALLFPGLPGTERPWQYVLHPAVPLWVSVLAAWGVVRGGRPMRIVAVWGIVFLGLALLPGIPFGSQVWLAVSRGLVRYPGRWLFLVVVLLIPLAAAAATHLRPSVRWGLGTGMAAWLVGGGLGSNVVIAGIQAMTLGVIVAVGGTSGAVAAVVAGAAIAAGPIGSLAWERDWRPAPVPCLEEQQGRFRVYGVEYSRHLADWIADDPEARTAGLAMGYHVLVDGRLSARSFGPLSPRPVTGHLREADRGPEGRWWLDALGAARFASFRPVPGFDVLCRDRGVVVMDNPQAWPLAAVVRELPAVGEQPAVVGTVTTLSETGGRRRWRVEAGEPGFLLWLETPDPGWRVRVDGTPSRLLRGPGILQAVPVAAGEAVVEVRYRPAGLVPGLAVSLLALGVLVGVRWRRW